MPYTSSQEVLDSLSSLLEDYGGYDAPPVAAGHRQANGMTWSLYTLSSYGRPVDLAMVDIGNGRRTLGVLLFCHNDEHDAFYKTLYLPIIDSLVLNQ